ncbi:MAG: hypothetical protein U1E53_21165 [Dongiaceae bacterium]
MLLVAATIWAAFLVGVLATALPHPRHNVVPVYFAPRPSAGGSGAADVRAGHPRILYLPASRRCSRPSPRSAARSTTWLWRRFGFALPTYALVSAAVRLAAGEAWRPVLAAMLLSPCRRPASTCRAARPPS